MPQVFRTSAEVGGRALLHIQAQAVPELIRTETLRGREHRVVPVVMMVEGVLDGANSIAPTLYRAAVFSVAAPSWNGKPVVYNHPQRDGNFVSANETSVYAEETIGLLFNTTVEDARLKSEMWLDVELIAGLEGERATVLERLASGDPVEVSVGALVTEEVASGAFNGKTYGRVATGIWPDHLAVLDVETKGACSVEDGCGAPRVNASACGCGGACDSCKEKTMPDTITLEAVTEGDAAKRHIYRLPEGQEGAIQRLDVAVPVADGPTGWPLFNADRTAVRLPGRPEGEVEAVLAAPKPEETAVKAAMKAVRTLFESAGLKAHLTHRDMREALQMALEVEGKDRWPWVIDIEPGASATSGAVIYEGDDMTIVRRSFEIAEGGAVTLSSETEAVRRETTWIPTVVVTNEQKEETMSKTLKERVGAIVAHERSQFTEADRTYLEGLEEKRIADIEAKLQDKAEEAPEAPAATAAEPTANAGKAEEPKEPVTVEQYLSSAPPEVREVLAAGQAELRAKRDRLVDQILKAGDAFTKEDLQAMSTTALEKTARLARPVDFSGRGGPRTAGSDDTRPAGPGYEPVVFGDNDPLAKKKADKAA